MDVQTYFFRRTNMNALGQPRSWTDHLLWHHAAHTVDLFAYQCGSPIVKANAVQGPIHPTLGIAMDMRIQLKAANGAICTLSLSFNNDGPLGTFFRYIGDSATYIARYDDLYHRQGREDRRQQGRGQHERHRAAGPRILRRHPRRPRAELERGPGAALLQGIGSAGEATRGGLDASSPPRALATLAGLERHRADFVPEAAGAMRPKATFRFGALNGDKRRGAVLHRAASP